MYKLQDKVMNKLKGKGHYDKQGPARKIIKKVSGEGVSEGKPTGKGKIVMGSKYGSPSKWENCS